MRIVGVGGGFVVYNIGFQKWWELVEEWVGWRSQVCSGLGRFRLVAGSGKKAWMRKVGRRMKRNSQSDLNFN